VTKVEAPWGRIIDAQQIADALKRVPTPKLVAVVHAETSTGALTPVEENLQADARGWRAFSARHGHVAGRLSGPDRRRAGGRRL